MKPIITLYDLGTAGGKVTVIYGPHSETQIEIEAARIGCTGNFTFGGEQNYCMGLCYTLSDGKSIIWINPEYDGFGTLEGVVHELSHFVDNWMEYYGYTDGELRARVMGSLSSEIMRDLGFKITKSRKK